MFKGIVEGTGKVLKISLLKNNRRLRISAPFGLFSVKKGDSIAVNGCCLTVVRLGEIPLSPSNPHLVGKFMDRSLRRPKRAKPDLRRTRSLFFEADLSHETLAVTNLKDLREGHLVNLERPLRLAGRIDGHLVQGHVDGVGTVLKVAKVGSSWEIEVGLPKALRRYVIPKGSIAVDGISMTVNRLKAASFTLVVIPHTFQATNLKAKRVGDPVNLEVDLIGKYVEKLLSCI